MTDNPYQTPTQSVDRSNLRRNRLGKGTFFIGESFSEAWSATTGNFGLVLVGGFLGMLLIFLSAITIIGYFVIVPVLVWGMTRFALNLIDGNAQINDIFSGFTNYGSKLARSLGLVVILVLLSLIGNIPSTLASL